MKMRPEIAQPHRPMRDDRELIRDALRDYAAVQFTALATKVKRYASASEIGAGVGEAVRCVELSEMQ